MTTPATPTSDASAEAPPPGARRTNLWHAALVASLVFLGGAVGYVIGVRGSDTPSSAVDVGFLIDMSDHHDQAVTMALIALERSKDPVVRGFAQDVLVFQRSELGTMSVYLAEQNAVRPDYDPSRSAMDWMGMPTALASMPGMASNGDLARLRSVDGTEFDSVFLGLMRSHHEGGIHMATFAASDAADPRVRELAARMARNQTIEVKEYDAYLARLGVSTSSPTTMSDDSTMDH